jgi:O-antigen ligase
MLQSARLGMYLITCALATFALLTSRSNWHRPGIFVAALAAPLYLTAIAFTYTRSVWMGTVLVTIVVAALALKGKVRTIALFGMGLVLAVGIAVKGSSLVAFERETSAADTLQSTQMRASFAYVSWKMFRERPLSGFGFGQFRQHSKNYLSDRTTSLHLEHIRGYVHHNTLLSLLVELGACGLVLFLALLAHWFQSGWLLYRNQRHPKWVRLHGLCMLCVLAAFSFQLLFRDVSYSPVENSLVFLFAGVTLSLRSRYEASSRFKVSLDNFRINKISLSER